MVNQGMVIKRMKVSQVLSRSRQIKVSLGRGYNYIKVKYWYTSKFRFSSSIQMKAEDVTVNQGQPRHRIRANLVSRGEVRRYTSKSRQMIQANQV